MSQVPNPERRSKSGSHHAAPHNLFSMELSRNLRVDSVSRLQPTPPLAIDDREPVSAAIETMRREKTGCLLVTRQGQLVGIFTERDLLKRVLAAGLPLSVPMAECLTPNPAKVSPKDSVQTAVERMEKGGYRHLPVVDEMNRPIGTLSAKRVVHYLAEHFPALVYNQPPDPTKMPETAEGA
ncbi:MAG TPA: CBS domain-containing protein [Urbifossiella sp.]|nr:CBS domain-containing protein [Urbifossiella sp.]